MVFTMIGWRRYNLWVKYFNTMEQAKEYIRNNPQNSVVVVKGEILYKTMSVNEEKFGGVF